MQQGLAVTEMFVGHRLGYTCFFRKGNQCQCIGAFSQDNGIGDIKQLYLALIAL